jgi:hypothetical protein
MDWPARFVGAAAAVIDDAGQPARPRHASALH